MGTAHPQEQTRQTPKHIFLFRQLANDRRPSEPKRGLRAGSAAGGEREFFCALLSRKAHKLRVSQSHVNTCSHMEGTALAPRCWIAPW